MSNQKRKRRKAQKKRQNYEGSQSEAVTQSDTKINPESETEDNVILIKTTENQSEESSAISGLSETLGQTEPVASPPETPVTEPASEPMEEIKRD